MTQYWLMKSEPDECSIDDALAAPGATVPWTGVRNYQARNFMRDAMQVGDGVLFYHSSCPQPGIAELRAAPELADLLILQRGNRLSVTPVSEAHWRFITERLLSR